MNGLTNKTPYSDESKDNIQLNLFDDVNNQEVQEDMFTLVKDWTNKVLVSMDSISKGDEMMKFDVVIGNPPYQEETKGDSTSSNPIYNYFMDEAFKLADKVCLITPARFLFNAGQTSKTWNKERLNDSHFKVNYYEQISSKVFPNTDIKGGVAITYRDCKRVLGPIDIFIAIPELQKIYKSVVKGGLFGESISSIIYPRTSYKLSKALHNDFPEAYKFLSKGHEFDLSSNIFERLAFIFYDDKPNDEYSYIQVLGRLKNERVLKWVRRDYIIEHPNLNKYKVFLPKSNGSGAIGEVLSTPLIGEPLVGGTETFMSFGAFDDKYDAESCLKYIFLVLTLTDEVYSVFTSSKIPNYLNRTKTMLWIAFIAYASWVLGCTVGGFISISIPGIDYVITEFFFLVMLSQLLLDKSYVPTTVGLFCSVAAFLLVGNNFILLAIIFSMLALLLLKKKLATNKGGKI